MNSSAKLSFTFLGALALGGAVFACTVSSGTVDDTDGGVNSSTSSSSGTAATSTSSSSSSGTTPTCASYTSTTAIDSTDCDNCLLGSCCTETGNLYNIDGGTAAVDEYVTDLQHCDTDPGAQGTEACKNLTFTSANDDGLATAYDRYLGCRQTNCQVCTTANNIPDAGTN